MGTEENLLKIDGKEISLTPIELRFIAFLQHEVPWGEVTITVRNGRPRRAKIIERQFVFDVEEGESKARKVAPRA